MRKKSTMRLQRGERNKGHQMGRLPGRRPSEQVIRTSCGVACPESREEGVQGLSIRCKSLPSPSCMSSRHRQSTAQSGLLQPIHQAQIFLPKATESSWHERPGSRPFSASSYIELQVNTPMYQSRLLAEALGHRW